MLPIHKEGFVSLMGHELLPLLSMQLEIPGEINEGGGEINGFTPTYCQPC